MREIRIQFLTKESELSFEKHIGDSETVEGQALPVIDILVKFQNGTLDMPIAKQTYYDNVDGFITDPTLAPDFDITDAHEHLNYIKTSIKEKELLKEKEAIKAKEALKNASQDMPETQKITKQEDTAE